MITLAYIVFYNEICPKSDYRTFGIIYMAFYKIYKYF